MWPQRDREAVKDCRVASVNREEHENSDAYLITMTPSLTVQGKCLPVLVRGLMPSNVHKNISLMTGSGLDEGNLNRSPSALHGKAMKSCNLICPMTSPATAGGYGSFERADVLQSTGKEAGYLTLALRIAIRKKITHGVSLGKGLSISGHDVVDVLFLEPVEEGENQFRRIGVGSLFERGILDAFQEVESMELILV